MVIDAWREACIGDDGVLANQGMMMLVRTVEIKAWKEKSS